MDNLGQVDGKKLTMEEIREKILERIAFENDVNYYEFTQKHGSENCQKEEGEGEEKKEVNEEEVVEESPQEAEVESRNLQSNGLGESLKNDIPKKRVLRAENIMKRPDQMLGFVPAYKGVWETQNSGYGSGRLQRY